MTMMGEREFAAGGPGHYPLRDPREGGGEGVGKTYKGDPTFQAGRRFKDDTIRKQQQELVKLYKLLGTFKLPQYQNFQSIKEYRDQLREIMEQRGMDPKELKMFDKGVPRFKGHPSTIDPQASIQDLYNRLDSLPMYAGGSARNMSDIGPALLEVSKLRLQNK